MENQGEWISVRASWFWSYSPGLASGIKILVKRLQYTNMANMEDLPCIQQRRILLIYQSFCSLSMLHCLLMHLLLSAVSYLDHKSSITQVYVKDYNRFLKTTPMHKYLDVHKYFSCDDISAWTFVSLSWAVFRWAANVTIFCLGPMSIHCWYYR